MGKIPLCTASYILPLYRLILYIFLGEKKDGPQNWPAQNEKIDFLAKF